MILTMYPMSQRSTQAVLPASERLHVVQVAPPWYPVPPCGYGGIESVVGLLAGDLRRRGHRVTLIAAEGSEPGATVRAPLEWRSALGRPDERLRELAYAANVAGTLRHLGGVDVIHDHVGFATLFGCLQIGTAPVVHTAHGVVTRDNADVFAALGSQLRLVSISHSQQRQAPQLAWVGTVANAVAVEDLRVDHREASEPYLLCLARICPDKGQHIAVEVARRAGMRLVLAGKVDCTPGSREYFERQVAPAIDGSRVIHIRNVAGVEKAQLLGRATALLAPIQWDEPFGLSVVEAMASGTPAISFARGAAPELIEEGETGFLVSDADTMVRAVRQAAEVDPAHCAAVARARFSPPAMTDGYLEIYEDALATAPTLPATTQPFRLSVGGQFPPGGTPADDAEVALPVNADVA
jgi:glycosyltransferase involved in cell wall biosynthesis